MTSPLRRHASSGSPLEPRIGFSRAVRVGSYICVAGTAPIDQAGGPTPDGVYAQTKLVLEIIGGALAGVGASFTDVVRTRVMLTDISQWQEAARAHGEVFGDIRPAATFVEVSGFIDPAWLVEMEIDAVAPA